MEQRPNFIVILTDDHGYGDLSCMGANDFVTPHLDRLAATGVRFTDFYANGAVCSPTRASLLSGRYPGNAGVRSILRGHRTATGLPAEVPTFATQLKAHGYRTCMSGKWHLGLAEGSRPQDHGFDRWFGHLAGCVDFFSHIFYWDKSIDPLHDLWEDGREVWRNGAYMTELITDKAVHYIRDAAAADEPFCLYVAYNAPHYPMHAPEKYLDRFPHLPPERRIMAAMISAIDDGVGELVAELERQGMTEDTCIMFCSDNGPSRETRNWLDGRTDPYLGGTPGPFKGHKFSLFEGGIRVPGLLNYPRQVPGGRVLDTPVASMDILPTMLGLAGLPADGLELDGVDLTPLLTKDQPLDERALYFEQGKQLAVRAGSWKLVLRGQLVEQEPATAETHLSDLAADPGEQVNLAEQQPEVTARLRTAVEAWHANIEQQWGERWAPREGGTVTFNR